MKKLHEKFLGTNNNEKNIFFARISSSLLLMLVCLVAMTGTKRMEKMSIGRALKFADCGRCFDFVSGAFLGLSENVMDNACNVWYHNVREQA